MDRTKRRPAPQRGHLSRQAILEAGLAILEAEGATALTMRRLAQALGVEAMSLYNHVRDKRDLLDGIASLVLSRVPIPDSQLPWRERLEAAFMSLYETLSANPWLVMMLATEQAEPSEPAILAGMDEILGAFEKAGLPPEQQVSAFRGMMALCWGLVLAHTLGLSMSLAQAEAHWAAWDPHQWDDALAPRLARLAPRFLTSRPLDDVRFMLDAFLSALERTRG